VSDTPEITKRRVTMSSVRKVDGVVVEMSATDFVRPDFLEVYVADARTRWQDVVVSDEPDAGPGGYHGETAVPVQLDHPLAGAVFAATTPED
jgi:hypothetical protein